MKLTTARLKKLIREEMIKYQDIPTEDLVNMDRMEKALKDADMPLTAEELAEKSGVDIEEIKTIVFDHVSMFREDDGYISLQN